MTTSSEHPLPPTPPPPAFTYPPIIIILSILLLIVFFAGFFSLYFCRCCVQNLLCFWHLRGSATNAPANGAAPSAGAGNGLDPSIVKSFPSFVYSTVKDYRVEKYGLECAICLIEFTDTDILRLLTTCCHVFHQECIDLWLESHHTCPVCRRNLTSPTSQSPVKPPIPSTAHENEPVVVVPPSLDEDDHHHVSFSITVKDENEGVSTRPSDRTVEKYPRSHSTGHSILRNKGNTSEEDRFTLRLPQHVKSRIIRGHNSSKSWSVFGEYKDKDYSANKSVAGVYGDENV